MLNPITTKEIARNERNLRIPPKLCEDGLAAARCILQFLRERNLSYTEDSELFYLPKKWLSTRHPVLLVNHARGQQTEVFCRGNWHIFKALNQELEKIGLRCIPCTCWYSAIWPISRSLQSKPGCAYADASDHSTANPLTQRDSSIEAAHQERMPSSL